MSKKSAGRMINTDIAESKGAAKLSPKALALFCLLIPHFNAHGKMPAGGGYIKDLVCPLVKWLTTRIIPRLLTDISMSTSVKYFCNDKGIHYLHNLNWKAHQKLQKNRLGIDRLPDYQDYSQSTRRVVSHEVEVEVEVEVKGKVKGKGKSARVSENCLTEMEIKYPQYDIPANLEQFYDYCKANRANKPYSDHDAAFRNRLGNTIPKIMKGGALKKLSSGAQTVAKRLQRHLENEKLLEAGSD